MGYVISGIGLLVIFFGIATTAQISLGVSVSILGAAIYIGSAVDNAAITIAKALKAGAADALGSNTK